MRTRFLLSCALMLALVTAGCGQGSSTSASGGSTTVDVVFLQAEGAAEIFGVVFDDVNGNGVMDSSETGIPGVIVSLAGYGSTLTDTGGMYAFAITVFGAYTVQETNPAGYVSTTPDTVVVHVTEATAYRVDFGDAVAPVPTYPITGTVFSDLNLNGVMDSGETGIPSVTVTLDGSLPVITNVLGQYAFASSVLGSHSVEATEPDGYVSTTTNPVAFDLTEAGFVADFGMVMVVEVPVDIKPGSVKNPVNLGSKGVTPVAILGSESFDVRTIDPATLLLESVTPLRWAWEDVAGASTQSMEYDKGAPGDMDETGPDGYEDMTLKFDTQELAAAIGQVMKGDVVTLHLEGVLKDGTPITGTETIYIVKAK